MQSFFEDIRDACLKNSDFLDKETPKEIFELPTTTGGVVIVKIQNVHEYLCKTEPEYSFLQYPNIAPPFGSYWMEYKFPKSGWNNGKWFEEDPMAGTDAGILFNAVETSTYPVPDGVHKNIADNYEKSKWLVHAHVFFRPIGQRDIVFFGVSLWLVMSNGEMVRTKHGGPAWGHIPMGSFERLQEITSPDISSGEPKYSKALDSIMSLESSTFFATTLMHCKNVTTTNSPKPSRQIRRQRERIGLPPSIQYKTLEIGSMTKIITKESGRLGVKDGHLSALHICRGHFKKFGDKPLFGKYRGTYWWPMTTRGSKAQGEIKKDYKINSDV